MSLKHCPFCSEQTSAAEIDCGNCGARLQELLLVSDPHFNSPRAHAPLVSVRTVLFCFIVCAGLVYALSVVWPHDAARTAGYSGQPPASKEPVYQTTAADLYKNYSAYEAAANLKTGSATVQISGAIKAIGQNMFDETEIELDVGDDPNSVTVTLDQSAPGETPSLARGGWVNVICEDMSKILSRPIGQSCQVLK